MQISFPIVNITFGYKMYGELDLGQITELAAELCK